MQEILKKIKPTKTEEKRTKQVVESFLQKINHATILGGSYAKGTHLKGNHDIDVFIPFKENKELSKKTKNLLKPFKKVTQVRGSRDYFQVQYQDYTFEVVPIYKITKASQAKNITDVSPLHVKWVKKHTTAKPKDEIRLTKQFFKAHHCYGAETYIQGFSGYVLEILTIHYGSCKKLLKAAITWQEHQVIDPAQHKEGLNRSKRSPLIVIDPVQKDRNAAAALSKQQFEKIRKAAKRYVAKPSKAAFTIRHPTKEKLQKRYDMVLCCNLLEGKKDIVATKAKKAALYIKKRLTEEGFKIQEMFFHVHDGALIAYKCKEQKISKTYIALGPPENKPDHIKRFKAKHKGKKITKVDGRLSVERKRTYTNATKALKAIIKEKQVKDRVAKLL